MTIARVANMGNHRIAVCSSLPERDPAVATAARCGCNIAPTAVYKAGLPFNRYIQRPDALLDFFLEQMPTASLHQFAPARRGAAA